MIPKSKYRSLTVIRPLIEVRKNQILQWLKDNGLSYRIDKTNLEETFLRNKIRISLLPFLKKFNPNIAQSLYNLAKIAALDYDFMHTASKNMFNQLKKHRSKSILKLQLDELKKMHPALILSLLRMAIEELKGDTRKLEWKHFEEMLDLIYHRPSLSVVDVPDLKIQKEDNWLIIKSLLF
jgi:tRNA(Ile)-lysidine synthase